MITDVAIVTAAGTAGTAVVAAAGIASTAGVGLRAVVTVASGEDRGEEERHNELGAGSEKGVRKGEKQHEGCEGLTGHEEGKVGEGLRSEGGSNDGPRIEGTPVEDRRLPKIDEPAPGVR